MLALRITAILAVLATAAGIALYLVTHDRKITAYLNTWNAKRRYFLSRVSRYRTIPAAVASTARIAAMRRASMGPRYRSAGRQGKQPGQGSRSVLLAFEGHVFPGMLGGKRRPQQTVVQGMAGFVGRKIADQRVSDQV